jgi:hypothetical protein
LNLPAQMPLVVLTYPGHFLLTALTIQSYFQHHPQVPTTVIVDDISNLCWDTYLDDCEELYNCKIIKASSINSAVMLKNNPWIRQQIIKLHLDLILPFNEWFFTDGDVEYHFLAPRPAIPYKITRGGETQQKQNNYVSKVLGISNPGIFASHPHMNWQPGTTYHQVCVSNPPFRSMHSDTLIQLREYINQTHTKDIVTLSSQELNNQDYLMSEWELIANFQMQILKQDINLVYYPTVPFDRLPDNRPNQPNYCSTGYEQDCAYSRIWWQSKGVEVSDRLWDIISKLEQPRHKYS